jgi:hypothetical protein
MERFLQKIEKKITALETLESYIVNFLAPRKLNVKLHHEYDKKIIVKSKLKNRDVKKIKV